MIGKEAGKDKLIAFAAYRLNCNEGGTPVAYLYELQLGVEARGSNPSLGKALMAEVEQRARLSGSGRLQLSVHEKNVAVGFYQCGCGYTQIGSREEEDPTRPDGKVTLLVLEKNCRGGEEQYVDVQEEAGECTRAAKGAGGASGAKGQTRVGAVARASATRRGRSGRVCLPLQCGVLLPSTSRAVGTRAPAGRPRVGRHWAGLVRLYELLGGHQRRVGAR